MMKKIGIWLKRGLMMMIAVMMKSLLLGLLGMISPTSYLVISYLDLNRVLDPDQVPLRQVLTLRIPQLRFHLRHLPWLLLLHHQRLRRRLPC
jgi:hypothetical protein